MSEDVSTDAAERSDDEATVTVTDADGSTHDYTVDVDDASTVVEEHDGNVVSTVGDPVEDEDAEPKTQAEKERAARTNLEGDLKQVLDNYVTGVLAVEDNKPLTCHQIARAIGKLRESRGESANPPSTGAVAAALDRWVEIGYISVSAKPKAFIDYTSDGREIGLKGLKDINRARKAAARAADRDAKKATDSKSPSRAPVEAAPTRDEVAAPDVPPAQPSGITPEVVLPADEDVDF